jgi:Arabinose efflux permease
MTLPTHRASARSAARPWLGLALLLLPTALVAVDINVLFLALPALTADLRVSPVERLWIVDSYGLVVGVLAIVAGSVGDRIGRRRLLLLGSAGFLVGSVVAAFAPSPEVLILARVVQGITGATLMPSTLALITELFADERARQKAVAAWATCMFASAAFGPVVGGVMLHFFWWGSVFLLAVPIGVLVLALGPRLLPEHVDPAHAPRVDGVGAGLLVAALACLFTGVKALIPGDTLSPGLALTATAAAAALGLWFIRRQIRVPEPLLDLRLLRRPPVGVTVASLVLAAIGLAGTGLWATQYLQTTAGLAPLAAAVTFAPMALGIAVGTSLAPALARRLPEYRLVPAGLALSAVAELLLGFGARSQSLAPIITAYALVGLGCGPLLAFGTHRVVSAAPARAAGRAAALAETGNHLGTAVGLAVLGTVGSAAAASALSTVEALSTAGATGALPTAGATGALPTAGAAGALSAVEALSAVSAVAAGLFLACAVANLAMLASTREAKVRA